MGAVNEAVQKPQWRNPSGFSAPHAGHTCAIVTRDYDSVDPRSLAITIGKASSQRHSPLASR
jgi:hypothetical protein